MKIMNSLAAFIVLGFGIASVQAFDLKRLEQIQKDVWVIERDYEQGNSSTVRMYGIKGKLDAVLKDINEHGELCSQESLLWLIVLVNDGNVFFTDARAIDKELVESVVADCLRMLRRHRSGSFGSDGYIVPYLDLLLLSVLDRFVRCHNYVWFREIPEVYSEFKKVLTLFLNNDETRLADKINSPFAEVYYIVARMLSVRTSVANGLPVGPEGPEALAMWQEVYNLFTERCGSVKIFYTPVVHTEEDANFIAPAGLVWVAKGDKKAQCVIS